MKPALSAWLLALAVFGFSGGRACAQTDAAEQEPLNRSALSSLTAHLAAQVQAIADSSLASHSKKDARISAAVRVAVVAATVYQDDPAAVTGVAMRLASAAAQAAPSYADSIARAAAFAPPVMRVASASGQIRSAVYAAVRGSRYARSHPRRVPAPPELAITESPDDRLASEAPAPPRRKRRQVVDPGLPADDPSGYVATETGSPPLPASEADTAMADPDTGRRRSAVKINQNTNAGVTLDLSAQHNDNVFLSSNRKQSDTLLSATPGARVGYGQNSLSHGTLVAQEAFVRYAKKTAPGAHLADVVADWGFADNGVKATASGSYQQLYQNNAQIAPLGQQTLLRTDTAAASASVEPQLGPKLSTAVGATWSETDYKQSTLVGTRNVGFPAALYYKLNPEVDLSSGFTFGESKPTSGGPTAHNYYYNLGARGAFTPKLTGNFSVGYRQQKVPGVATESLVGFEGKFDYQATDKTTATLALARGFDISALGQTDQNSSAALVVKTAFTSQFALSLNASYQHVDYGLPLFSTPKTIGFTTARVDSYWSGGLIASYAFTTWCSAAANYTLRSNHSTLAEAAFDNNLLSLTLGLQY